MFANKKPKVTLGFLMHIFYDENMRGIFTFLKEIGNLKNVKRQGILFYGFKNPDSATDHTFRLAMMGWVLGTRKGLELEKVFKLALIHDICKVSTGDITPYDGLFPKKGRDKYKLAWRWRRLPVEEKEKRYKEKYKKEYAAVINLVKKLPKEIKTDMIQSWMEYQGLKSPEAQFVYQLDRAENLLEALECWEQQKTFPTQPWWEHADEVIHDEVLLDFIKEIEEAELKQR